MKSSRRRFLQLAGSVAAVGSWPSRAVRAAPLPSGRTPDEAFWQVVKAQFPVRDGLVMMNAANLCPAPFPVIDAVTALTRSIDADASFQNRARFGPLTEHARQLIARHVGADEDEIAITRNTSESNNTVVNGLELDARDEVLLWDQNHPTNSLSWDVKADRLGFAVRRVATPDAPGTEDELFDALAGAVTDRTRVLAFSHVSNATGIRMPARRLCHFARERGIYTLVDGAQSFGALALDLHDMGCDFFTGSSHKWFLGPKEAGILYVRRERIGDLWPTHVGVGYPRALDRGAQKFDNLGQRDDACVAAMGTAADFHAGIGRPVIEARITELVGALRAGLRERIPGVRFSGATDPGLTAGVLVVIPPRGDARAIYDALYTEHQIAGAPRPDGIRFSPHVYNTLSDVDRVIDALAALV